MNNYSLILNKLERSRFRSKFKLSEKDKQTISEKGFNIVASEVFDILDKRIKVKPENDGRQTPFGNYYVFIAQHATATCCRKCISKWHRIPENKILDDQEIKFLLEIILIWINKEMK